MNLARILQSVALTHPGAPAVTAGEHVLDYASLSVQVDAIAAALTDTHQLSPGNRVALVMENCAEFFPCLYGIWRAGLVAVPINAKLHPREIAWIIADSQCRLVIATPELAAGMARSEQTTWPPIIVTGSRAYKDLLAGRTAPPMPNDPEADAWLFYTSGTTGRPKGAVLTHRSLLFMCHCYYADIDQIGPGDTMLHAAPLSHGAGLYGLAHISRGSNNVILTGSFEPAHIFSVFARHPNVAMFAAPTMVVRLVAYAAATKPDTRNLRTIIYGGAPMYVADLERALEVFGPRLYQVYGQGESPMTITGLDKRAHADTSHPRHQARLASSGVARTGVAVKIVRADGAVAVAGETGEIATRSDCVMRGYWNNMSANAETLREGWLMTGDLGVMDADGYLTLMDRSKDLIISGGANIYPREIEEVLLTHGSVAECAVVSRPHPEWGEEAIAFVVERTANGAAKAIDTAELDTLCLANIARFKRPKGYRFVSELPKNNYGKVLKTALRKLLLDEIQS